MRAYVLAILVLAAAPALSGCGTDPCPSLDTLSAPDAAEDTAAEPAAEVTSEIASDAPLPPADVPTDPGQPSAPTYWSAEATDPLVKDDLAFAAWHGQRVFALGFDAGKSPIWDGLHTTGCDEDTGVGYYDYVLEGYDRALKAGANFAFVWGYPSPSWPYYDQWLGTLSQLYGKWYDGWAIDRPADHDVMPIVYNPWGESDFDNPDVEGTIAEHQATLQAWTARTGEFSPENRPNLPPYDELPWIGWHPTWRSRGGGDGTGEVLTDAQAKGLINAANFAFGDNYTYVTNRYPAALGAVTGQKGDEGEGYDDWVAAADPDHASMFQGAWEVVDAVERFATHPMLRWMWIQGYSFGYSLKEGVCSEGMSDSWATGWYPSLPYLRKEVTSAIAGGATGIVYFGYLGAHPIDREKADTVFRALSHPDVYEPALLSPRLEIAPKDQLLHAGDGGRLHVIVKWHEASKTAYVIGANPGPWETRGTFTFPWSLDKAEWLMWGSGRFAPSPRVVVDDRALTLTAPMDEGFVLRVTPKMAP